MVERIYPKGSPVGAIDVELVTVDVIREHGHSLMLEHWEETGKKAPVPEPLPDPDWKCYYELELRGMLVIYAARPRSAGWDQILGYGVMFVLLHPHHVQTKVAKLDLLFVRKSARRIGDVGRRLVRAHEAAAREAGAKLVLIPAKPGSVGDVLAGLGYAMQEVTWAKAV